MCLKGIRQLHISRTQPTITSRWSEYVAEGPSWNTKWGPKFLWRDPIGTQFQTRGTETWSRGPKRCPNWGPNLGPNCVFAYSFEQNRLLGTAAWVGTVGLEASLPAWTATSFKSFGSTIGSLQRNWVPIGSLQKRLGPSEAGSDDHEVTATGVWLPRACRHQFSSRAHSWSLEALRFLASRFLSAREACSLEGFQSWFLFCLRAFSSKVP